MYAILFLVAAFCLVQLVQTFFGIPILSTVGGFLERFVGGNHGKFFLAVALSAVALYAVGLTVLGPFIGVHQAACQVASLCMVIFLAGVAKSTLGVGRDSVSLIASVGGKQIKGDSRATVPSGVFFLTGMFGVVLFMLVFFQHGDRLFSL